MEHMIGLTDTAYLGRVGEVELGAPLGRSLLSCDLYAGLWFQCRRSGADGTS